MGKSQFLLLNPIGVRAHKEAVGMIGVQKVRISIRARGNISLHIKAGYMTDALFSSKKLLTHTDGPYMTPRKMRDLQEVLRLLMRESRGYR
jgi:hypothetical protein